LSRLTPHLAETLKEAIAAYDFPKVLFDFDRQKEIRFPTMRELEAELLSCLLSDDPERVKRGLANVLYWGYARIMYRRTRVENFRTKVTDDQLRKARSTFATLDGGGLIRLKRLGLPEFSHVSFLSKLRMFLDPRRYVVLDKKLMKLANEEPATLFRRMTESKTSIPVTRRNEAGYERWCLLCQDVGRANFPGEDLHAADVERGVFWLVDSGRAKLAAEIVNEAERDEPLVSPGGMS